MDLSATARVILGFLAVEPRSGYDIKQIVDRSTRFFWAASYGQIYPELKRLEAAGLVAEAGRASGGRRRVTYRVTPSGEEALHAWLESPELLLELRDEGLLKVFFAGLPNGATIREVLAKKRDVHLEAIARLEAIEPAAASAGRFGPLEVLHYGIGLHRFSADWCERTLNELEENE